MSRVLADVTSAAGELWQMKVGESLVQSEFVQRILIVAAVVAVEKPLKSPVRPSVAAGAVFHHQVRMTLPESCEQFVKIFHIADPDGTFTG